MQSDEQLMAAYARGDQAAFSELFQRHTAALLRLMRRRISSPELAEDLVQQTFLQLHRARLDYDSERSFRPWLWTIAMNLLREHFRRRHRRPEAALDHDPATSNGQPSEMVEQAERATRLRAAVAALPEGQREVIELHWFDELSFPEVAQVLGVGLSAVKVRAHRGYRALATTLENVTVEAAPPYAQERGPS